MCDNMEIVKTPKRISQIELEKEVFGYAIDAHRTYSNKRRSSYGDLSKLTKENLSFQGKSYTPLKVMDQQNEINLKVRPWLENCSRAAFLDLDPNLGHHCASKKMCLRSTSRFEGIENQPPNSHTKSIGSSPKKSLEKKLLRRFKKKTKNEKLPDYKRNCKGAQKEVIVSQKSESLQSDNKIVIEDCRKTHLDKDQLAYLEVLKQAHREQVTNLGGDDHIEFHPVNENVRKCLKHNVDSLQHEISKLEKNQTETVRLYHSLDQTMIWPTRSLLNIFNSNAKSVREMLQKLNIQKHKIRKPPDEINVARKRILLKTKGTLRNRYTNRRKRLFKGKRIYMLKHKPKLTNTVSLQTDIPCTHNEKSESIFNIATSPEHEITNKEGNIIATFIPKNYQNSQVDITKTCEKIPEVQQTNFSLNSAETSYGVLSDSEGSVYKNSGNHTINVEVHAGMDSQDSDNSSVVSAAYLKRAIFSPDPVLPRTSPETDRSPSLLWEELHRTPPRSSQCATSGPSPTYTLTPPSNSSSNKENYAPNRTPSPDAKKLNKTKGNKTEHVRVRPPLASLFEAPRMKVYVCCSNLRQVELMSVMYVCTKLGWVYCEEYSCDVTHLVVKVDDDNRAQRDEKYYRAVAAGCYILSYRWIDQCVREDCHCVEDEFEALDCSGEPGPRRSRTAYEKLFTGITFSSRPTVASIHMLNSCLEVAGAQLVTAAQLAGTSLVGPVVVLNNPLLDEDQEMFKDAASRWKLPFVILNYKWALECIGRHRRVSPDTFVISPQDRASRHVAWLHSLCEKRDGQTHV